MTLQDLIDFLWDETERGTLTRRQIARCIILAHEMGIDLGRLERWQPQRPVPLERTQEERQ